VALVPTSTRVRSEKRVFNLLVRAFPRLSPRIGGFHIVRIEHGLCERRQAGDHRLCPTRAKRMMAVGEDGPSPLARFVDLPDPTESESVYVNLICRGHFWSARERHDARVNAMSE
jgi:hypothetical protein